MKDIQSDVFLGGILTGCSLAVGPVVVGNIDFSEIYKRLD
jgi:hypothetical protein